jgi:hypothetical protein
MANGSRGEHWLTIDFERPRTDVAEQQSYNYYYQGYVDCHNKTDTVYHTVNCEWTPDGKSLKVFLDPLEDSNHPVKTYNVPAVGRVRSGAASSDPPIPPPPPPR